MAFEDDLRAFGPPCHGKGCGDVGADEQWRVWADHEYGMCPWQALRDPEVVGAVRLYAQKNVSPLADWPDGWAAWATQGVVAIEAAINQWKKREYERARNRGS